MKSNYNKFPTTYIEGYDDSAWAGYAPILDLSLIHI